MAPSTSRRRAPRRRARRSTSSSRRSPPAPGRPHGEHGSSVKLAHAVGALALNAYRRRAERCRRCSMRRSRRSSTDADDGRRAPRPRSWPPPRSSRAACRRCPARRARARRAADARPSSRTLLLAGAIEAPLPRRGPPPRRDARCRDFNVSSPRAFFGVPRAAAREPRALVFTDTFAETNGVAGTMRLLAAAGQPGSCRCGRHVRRGHGRAGRLVRARLVVSAARLRSARHARAARSPRCSRSSRREQPDVIHVATPGPVGLCGLAAARRSGSRWSARTTPSSAPTRCI